MSEEWRRAMGLVAASWRVLLALWVLALFGSVWLHLPEPVRYSRGLFTFGIALMLAALHVFVVLAATAPIRRRLRELRQHTGALVELVGLDPAWLPVDGGATGAHRPGLVIADGTGIRLTDLDRRESVLDAPWPAVTAVGIDHAPRPVVVLESTVRWWFTLWRPAALPDWILPRTRRLRRLVARLDALREASAVATR